MTALYGICGINVDVAGLVKSDQTYQAYDTLKRNCGTSSFFGSSLLLRALITWRS